MTCDETRELLIDRLDGALPPERDAAVSAHIAECPACREELLALREAEAAARSLSRVKAPEDFLERFRERLAKEGLAEPGRASLPAAGTAAGPAAAAAPARRIASVPKAFAAIAALLFLAAGVSLVTFQGMRSVPPPERPRVAKPAGSGVEGHGFPGAAGREAATLDGKRRPVEGREGTIAPSEKETAEREPGEKEALRAPVEERASLEESLAAKLDVEAREPRDRGAKTAAGEKVREEAEKKAIEEKRRVYDEALARSDLVPGGVPPEAKPEAPQPSGGATSALSTLPPGPKKSIAETLAPLSGAAKAPSAARGEPIEVVYFPIAAFDVEDARQRAEAALRRARAEAEAGRAMGGGRLEPPGAGPGAGRIRDGEGRAGAAAPSVTALVVGDVTETQLATLVEALAALPEVRLGVPERFEAGELFGMGGEKGEFERDARKTTSGGGREAAKSPPPRPGTPSPVTGTAESGARAARLLRVVIEIAREKPPAQPSAEEAEKARR